MKQVNPRLRIVSLWILIFCLGSTSVYGYNENVSPNSIYDSTPEQVVKEIGVGSNKYISPINPTVNLVSKPSRITASSLSETISSSGSLLNRPNSSSPLIRQVSSNTPTTCVDNVSSTRNVSNSSGFRDALNDSTVSCINIISEFSITIINTDPVYSTITRSKTIVNNTTNANVIKLYTASSSIYNVNLFYTASNVDINLYNISIEHSDLHVITNFSLFYGFKTINLSKTKLLQNFATVNTQIAYDNKSNAIGATFTNGTTSFITDTINITNESEISGSSSSGNVIVANNINISKSKVHTHTSNVAGIYAFSSLNIDQQSVINSLVYPNGAGMFAGQSLSVNSSTINVTFFKSIENSYGIVVEKQATITGSIINVMNASNSSLYLGNASLLIDSRNTGEEAVVLTTTTINLNDVARVFKGKKMALNSSNITQNASNIYINTIGDLGKYISADSLTLTNNSSITFNTDTENFLAGYTNLNSDLTVNNSSISLNYRLNFRSNSNTIYFSNINNLSVNNGQIKISHFGSRLLDSILYPNAMSSNPATLGFAKVTGKVAITGNDNIFSVKKASMNGSTVVRKNYDEGFNIAAEHTFIKMLLTSSTFELKNGSLNYEGNVSLISTDVEIDVKLENSALIANMTDGNTQTSATAHSFMSLRDGITGKIKLALSQSTLDITHKSNLVPSNETSIPQVSEIKPTISIFDEVNITENGVSKITLQSNNSVIKIKDISRIAFSGGSTGTDVIRADKLAHNATPIEMGSITLNDNSTFQYENNHEFYPVIRAASFVSNNSNVSFKVAGFFHNNTVADRIEADNYYHLLYDKVAGTIFDFNLLRSSNNYIGGTLKILSSYNNNILNSRILTNESANITATIDYSNTVTYGGSDPGREFVPYLPMTESAQMQTITIKGNRAINSSVYVAQDDTNLSMPSVTRYIADIPFPVTGSNPSYSTIFFANTNRRREAIFGDYVVKFDQRIIQDSVDSKYYLRGFTTPNTTIQLGSTFATYEGGTLSNGLISFKLEVPSDQISNTLNLVTKHVVKEGNSLANVSNNANPKLSLTRHYQYTALAQVLDLNFEPNYNSIVFNDQNINMTPQYLNRVSGNVFKINITDTRYNTPGWTLKLCVANDLTTTFNGSPMPLYNSLSFKKSDSSYTDLGTDCQNGLVIAENGVLKPAQTQIIWDNTQGVLLNISKPELILKGKEYSGSLKFILVSK